MTTCIFLVLLLITYTYVTFSLKSYVEKLDGMQKEKGDIKLQQYAFLFSLCFKVALEIWQCQAHIREAQWTKKEQFIDCVLHILASILY